MSNSSLVNYTKISPNSNNPRKDVIKKITIHHMAGNLTIEQCGELFAKSSRQASANYGIGTDGRVGMYVEECNRAWTSGNADNDNQAVTIEVANDGGADTNWHVSDTALAKLIDLCVDICKRNDIPKLNFTGNATGNLTMHCYFQATACPGPYLKSKFSYIADEVNKKLKAEAATGSTETLLYRVQVGAYSVKSNADAMLARVKAAGFDTYMVQINGLYKIQVGAYSIRANADAMLAKVKAAGFDAFITTEQGKAVSGTAATVKEITVGSTVKLNQGAKTYEGKSLAGFVYARNHEVKEINGDRVVITYQGTVVAAVKKSDLTLV